MRQPTLSVVAVVGFWLTVGSAAPSGHDIQWQAIQSGVDLAIVSTPAGPLYVVRVDPRRARLQVALASEEGSPRTAAEWCKTAGLAVAINLGMFQNDGRSNVGYLRHGTHVNNPRWNRDRSLLAANPNDPSRPPLVWRDLDTWGGLSSPPGRAESPSYVHSQAPGTADLGRYDIVVQNLRLITTTRKNVWSQSAKRWSEAAVAIDSKGRLLFLFSRTPYSMRDFNALLLRLPLDIAGAMHVEGGPEASLSIHTAAVNIDLSGSYETGFNENDLNHVQWAIPNVLGVMR